MHLSSTASLKFIASAAGLLVTVSANATPITFAGSQGNLAASATFDVSGNSLIITLTNTSTADVLMQSDLLQAVFFNISGPLVTLTPNTGSVVLAPGSNVLFGTTDAGGVVGGEWAYAAGISGSSPNGANYGVSAAGFGIFGSANFPGSNLQGPAAVDGAQYGITSAGDNPATGQGAVTGSNALIKNSVVITLPGLPAQFDPSISISNVFFQYGTSLSPDPGFVGTPVPGPGSIAALLLAGLAGRGRSRRRLQD